MQNLYISSLYNWRRILFHLTRTGVGIGLFHYHQYKQFHNNYIIAEDIKYTLYQYQFKVASYVENKQFDQLIEFLWKELIKISSSGKGDPDIIDFLENKLCGNLVRLGKFSEAIQIIQQYSDKELIDNQSLLKVAFIYHSAKYYQRALDLYQLSLDNLDQQLKNKINENIDKDHLSAIKNEIQFTVNMQIAQCYTGLNQFEKVKDIYSDLKIDEIVHYGADQSIIDWYNNFATKEESQRFQCFINEYKAQFQQD